MPAHVHAALMAEYAKDAQTNEKPWELWECRDHGLWYNCSTHPCWSRHVEYRRKRKTHIVNGKEVAAPLDKIEKGQTVWAFCPVTALATKVKAYLVEIPPNWQFEIERGLTFATKEDAIENFEAYFPVRINSESK